VRRRDIGRVWEVWDSFQRVVLEKVLGHPRIMGGCIVIVNNPFFCFESRPPGKNRSSEGTKFWSMKHDSLMKAPGGNIVTTWNPWGFHKMVNMLFLDAMVLFAITGVFSSVAVHIRSRTYSWSNRSRLPCRNDANYCAGVHGAWELIGCTWSNEFVSVHSSGCGESTLTL
jgi:hypothetical protein